VGFTHAAAIEAGGGRIAADDAHPRPVQRVFAPGKAPNTGETPTGVPSTVSRRSEVRTGSRARDRCRNLHLASIDEPRYCLDDHNDFIFQLTFGAPAGPPP